MDSTIKLWQRHSRPNGDRKEAIKLQSGKARMSGLHIGGVIDIETGNIATLFLPQLTTAHKGCFIKTTKEEKGTAMKRLLDSSNKARPAGDPIVSHHDMEHHCKVMYKSMSMGDYAETEVTDFSAKSGQVTMWCWWPL